jgi:hypothetical protein
MIEAIVVVLSLHHAIVATGHFAPPRTFPTVDECMVWLDTPEGDKAWRELGHEYREIQHQPVAIVAACYKQDSI